MDYKEFLQNKINKIHTTKLGEVRIRKNLHLTVEDVVDFCKKLIIDPDNIIEKCGKNFYVKNNNVTLTINSYSFTIITAHINY